MYSDDITAVHLRLQYWESGGGGHFLCSFGVIWVWASASFSVDCIRLVFGFEGLYYLV
jgi:hypothetical protein